MRDFTLKVYRKLLIELKKANYAFHTFEKYISIKRDLKKFVIIRHDIDRKPENALIMAKLENGLGIKSSYYFRIGKKSCNKSIINQIIELSHEIGYHYEDLTLAKGNYEKAVTLFEKNLNYFRQFYPVKTICMHGSPMSKWDNRLIWGKIDYKNYGIIGEHYFDVDFNKVGYLTDTGRKWNSDKENLRDKVKTAFNYNYRTTFEVTNAINNDELPVQVMISVHPQRWNDKFIPWFFELVFQNLKNIIKEPYSFILNRRTRCL